MTSLFIAMQYLIPQHLFSHLVGILAKCRWRFVKVPFIRLFARVYGVNMEEARNPDPVSYESFNDFFTRELKRDARVICQAPDTIASPVDGCVSELGNLVDDCLIQAKGMDYSLSHLLGHSNSLTDSFRNGSFATLYLSPKDYHRVHAPISASLVESFYIPGKLFSVNQTTVRRIPGLFTKNERLVTVFNSPAGKMALVMVGAMIVRGIRTTWHQGVYPAGRVARDSLDVWPDFGKGDELARFELGSTVILLFGPGAICWDQQLKPRDIIKLGQQLATINPPKP